jgi:tRNA(Ile)-lysidine synthase
MPDLQQRFDAALENLNPARTLVVGVSGGVDSMALLELLGQRGKLAGTLALPADERQGRGRTRLVVAHFNHQLRGTESDGDEAFVREEAARRGFEFRAGRGDVRAEAKGISIEMAARKLRHAFLAEVASEVGGDIVLAHHADDQIELVLMRARRGVEGYGASGMREVSPSSANPKIRVLRPLLHFRKAELRELVELRQLPFREDSSNAQLDAERNRVRHKIIPALREHLGPQIEQSILQYIETARAQDDWWRQAANGWVEGHFAALPERLKREIIVVQLERLGISPSGKVLDPIIESNGKPVSIAPGVRVALNAHGKLRVFEEPPDSEPLWLDLHLDNGHAEFAGGKLEWAINNAEDTDLSGGSGMMVFDAAVLGQHIVLRHPEEGDRVRLSGRSSERTLFDVLARNKIPQEQRSRVVVAATKDGEVFWVEGLRITEDFKVTKSTDFVIEWKWSRERPQ